MIKRSVLVLLALSLAGYLYAGGQFGSGAKVSRPSMNAAGAEQAMAQTPVLAVPQPLRRFADPNAATIYDCYKSVFENATGVPTVEELDEWYSGKVVTQADVNKLHNSILVGAKRPWAEEDGPPKPSVFRTLSAYPYDEFPAKWEDWSHIPNFNIDMADQLKKDRTQWDKSSPSVEVADDGVISSGRDIGKRGGGDLFKIRKAGKYIVVEHKMEYPAFGMSLVDYGIYYRKMTPQ